MKTIVGLTIFVLMFSFAGTVSAHNVYCADGYTVCSVIPQEVWDKEMAKVQARAMRSWPVFAPGQNVLDELGFVVDICPWWFPMGCVWYGNN